MELSPLSRQGEHASPFVGRSVKRERQTDKPKNRLLALSYREHIGSHQRGRARGGMSDGESGHTRCDGHRVMYRSGESLGCTPATHITVYVNHTGISS